LILILCVVFATPALSSGMSAPAGALVAEAANYSVGTETDLRTALAGAANGEVIEVVADIELTGGALAWDDRTLTITGGSGDVTLRRGKDFPDVPIMEIGGKDPSQTTSAGVILEKIIIDDNNQEKGSYDGVLCAYRQNVEITLGDSATIRRAGGGGGVYLSGTPSSGPKLTMQDGGLIMDAKSTNGALGAGVFVGTGAAFTMEGGSIRNNVTTSAGGGVYVAGGATFVMKDGLIRGNTAPAGGGVLVSGEGAGGVFTMEGGVITGNMLSGAGVNQHGQDIAVEAPYGPTSPDYADKAFFAEIHPGATVDAGKIGVQNKTPGGDGKVFNQAVYLPSSRSAPVRVGALDQYGDTTALDALTSAAIAAMPVATYAGLTYAGNVVYAPAGNSGRIEVALNYPDEIPVYDSNGLNIRNRYGYAIAYVPLNANGTTAGAVTITTAARSSESQNLIAEIRTVAGAAAYGVVKYYYEKFGAFDVALSSVGLGGGSLVEKDSGLSGPLRFESIPSGSGFTPSPSAFTLRAIPADDSWKIGSVKVTAGDEYVIWKDVDANNEFILYYTDLAPGVNKVEVEFIPSDGSVRLLMDDASFVYDDRPHSVPVSGLARGDEVLYQYRVGDSGFFTSANGSPAFRDVNRVVAGSRGVGEEEIIVYVTVTRGAVSARDSASLTILPRPVTVKPVDREKEYDGSPLTPNAAEVSGGTLVAGHSLDVSSAVFGGSLTRAGTSESTVTGASIAGTNPANYAISYAPGRLTVIAPAADKEEVVVEEDGQDKKDKKDKKDDDDGGGEGYTSGGEADGPDDGEGAEEGAGGAPGDGVEGGGEDETLDDSPVPTTTREDESGLPPYWFIWLMIVIIAAGLWFLIVFWRKRRRDDEKGFDESDRF
jgi:hypothetical protein